MRKLINKKVITQTLVLIMLLFVFLGSTHAQKKIERNLKDYKVGNSLEDVDSRWGNAEKSGAMDHIHNYVWELWEKKELAYFKVVNYGLEGVISLDTYYIEKGKDGNWQVTVESDLGDYCPYKSKKKCEKYRYQTYIYKELEKIVDENGKTTIKFGKAQKL